ncbi:MAG: hypothetical protein KDA81_13950 [Planctomycetaceae bacterium]|nr:hypothetical protein [Planctomycetaceae bacterium]
MDTELLINSISRIAHVGMVIVLVGGTAFLRFALLPSLEGDSTALMDRVRGRWKKFVHAGIGIILISGFYNFFTMIPRHKGDSLYHALLGTKILLALYLFFLASVLVGNRPSSQKFRDNARKWTGVSLLIAALIVAVSGFVKVRPIPAERSPVTTATPTPTDATVAD